jgi:hypothetical protein
VARKREICRAHRADRARGIADDCNSRHAMGSLNELPLQVVTSTIRQACGEHIITCTSQCTSAYARTVQVRLPVLSFQGHAA